jgi:hypothetical protein
MEDNDRQSAIAAWAAKGLPVSLGKKTEDQLVCLEWVA